MLGQPHHGAFGIHIRKILLLDLQLGTVKIGNVLRYDDIGKDLRGGGRIDLLRGVFLKNNVAGIQILHIYRVGYGIDVTAVVRRIRGQDRYGDQQ